MDFVIVIFLTVITILLVKIYNQREGKRGESQAEEYSEQKHSQFVEKYPYLAGNLEGNWLQVFDQYTETDGAILKLAWSMYAQASTKIDFSEGSLKWDGLWGVTEELLEHLERFHEGSILEHEIAVATFWKIAADALEEIVEENPEIEGGKLEVEPFTSISDILSLFPKRDSHPDNEFSFFDEKGSFPRESEGSAYVQKKLKDLGL